jgi:hypothetical protein
MPFHEYLFFCWIYNSFVFTYFFHALLVATTLIINNIYPLNSYCSNLVAGLVMRGVLRGKDLLILGQGRGH